MVEEETGGQNGAPDPPNPWKVLGDRRETEETVFSPRTDPAHSPGLHFSRDRSKCAVDGAVGTVGLMVQGSPQYAGQWAPGHTAVENHLQTDPRRRREGLELHSRGLEANDGQHLGSVLTAEGSGALYAMYVSRIHCGLTYAYVCIEVCVCVHVYKTLCFVFHSLFYCFESIICLEVQLVSLAH